MSISRICSLLLLIFTSTYAQAALVTQASFVATLDGTAVSHDRSGGPVAEASCVASNG